MVVYDGESVFVRVYLRPYHTVRRVVAGIGAVIAFATLTVTGYFAVFMVIKALTLGHSSTSISIGA